MEIWELESCGILHVKDKSLYEMKRKLKRQKRQLENRSIESIQSEKQREEE